ncbi:MAG: hypothetical protein AAGA02_02345 [Bacteroidota bacterium]
MSEETKVDRDYKEAFNQGYEVAKELGLKPDALEGINAGNNRIQGIKDGMEQYSKELTRDKEVIPPLDLDSLDDNHIDLTVDNESIDKGRDIDI